MSSLIGWVVLLSMLLAVAGGLYWQNMRGAAIGILAGVILGLITWVRNIAVILFPDSFVTYANDTVSVPQPDNRTIGHVVMSITIPEVGTRQLRGLTQDEWHRLASGIVERGYSYTTRVLQDIFGASEGNRIYSRVTQQLAEAGVLMPSGSNGVAVTEHIGKNFFDRLNEKDYQVFDSFPYSAPKSV